ncbi:ribosomal protein S2, flavodoxin-like domain-containing protein [Geopyxis carbonaria]|nr:ribosomal protein S2, flavodoxin-like domain-containing protein [Geopyxis carbonaria]
MFYLWLLMNAKSKIPTISNCNCNNIPLPTTKPTMILRRFLRKGGQLPLSPTIRVVSRSLTSASPGPESDLTHHGKVLPDYLHSTESQTVRPIDADRPTTLREDYENFKHFKSTTGRLGSRVGRHYQPHLAVNNPPRPRDITLELLLASGAHLGHATSLWNPGNQRYIFGVRQGIHIISLEATAAHLRRAAQVVEGVARQAGLILFVGNRPKQERCVVEAAELAGGCHLFEKWTPGTITNGKMIVGHGAVVEKDEADRVNPQGPLEGAPPIRPDLVVCLNPLENYVMLHECGLFGIPTIGIIDTDADPTWVTYPIPANDDSLRSVQLIAGILGRAGESGRSRRLRKIQMQEQEDLTRVDIQ